MAKPRNKSKSRPDWRTVCRQLAEKKATAEARRSWKASGTAVIPFNYRWDHVQTVVTLALRLAEQTGADPEIVAAAAWLHDIRKGSPNHGINGAREARRILGVTNFPPEKIPGVVNAITQHVGLYRAPDAAPLEPVEAAVLWDADKLSKLGVQALAYNLSMGYMRGLDLAQRRSNMLEFTTAVLYRTVASMNTAPARAEAELRYRSMVAMLEIWRHEDEGDDAGDDAAESADNDEAEPTAPATMAPGGDSAVENLPEDP